MTDKLAVCSWSGGKDSCFAFYTALAQGIKVSHLVNTVSKQFRRVRFHGVKAEIIQAQADAIGINLIQKETSGDGYEKEFREAVGALAKDGIAWIVTGDIHLEDSRRWIENVSADLGLRVLTPLWGRKSEDILKEFIESGFEAMVVSAQADIFDKSWVGRQVDRQFLGDIKNIKGIDACGENGEYHTLVTAGPIFKKKIGIGKTRVVRKDTHWLLDISLSHLRNCENNVDKETFPHFRKCGNDEVINLPAEPACPQTGQIVYFLERGCVKKANLSS